MLSDTASNTVSQKNQNVTILFHYYSDIHEPILILWHQSQATEKVDNQKVI